MTAATVTPTGEPAEESTSSQPASAPQPLTIWPIVVIAALHAALVVFWLTPSINNFIRFVAMMAGPLVFTLMFAISLLLLRGMRKSHALVLIVAMAGMGVVTGLTAAHRSGIGAWILGVPLCLILCTVGLALSRTSTAAARNRRVLMITAAGWLLMGLTRIDGIDGQYMPEMSWRWQATAEERLLTELEDSPLTTAAADWVQTEDGWSGFRGPDRNAKVTETITRQDWDAQPPTEVWRRRVGPGWSSMAVTSGRLFTQEQRGDDEATTCYDALTGEPLWVHLETARFEEVVSGAGPRGTPTVAQGTVYSCGARGILTALDGRDGRLIWRKDLMTEYSSQLPIWGYSASPLVVDDLVIAFAGGEGDAGLLALDRLTGDVVWSTPSPNSNYGSAQLATLDGVQQVIFVEPKAVRGLDLTSGAELWRSEVVEERSFPMVQPQQVSDTSLIVTTGDGKNVVRVDVQQSGGAWETTVGWESRYLKPSYNDFVAFGPSLFGFDKQIFACIDVETGERRWKNGRYGFGQALLLDACGQIVVVAESGRLVLLDADENQWTEMGAVEAMSAKTWNHPAFLNGLLYVRNAEEMVCYRLP